MNGNRLWLLTLSTSGTVRSTCVVAAQNGDAALGLAPTGGLWATVPRDVSTMLLGEALPSTEPGIICRGADRA